MSTSFSARMEFDAGGSPPAMCIAIFAAVRKPPMGNSTALPEEGRRSSKPNL